MTSSPKSEGGWTPDLAYIVWNEGRNEGAIFCGEEGEDDAHECANRSFGFISSSLGRAFAEDVYNEDEFSVETVSLTLARAAPSLVEALHGLFDGGFIEAGTRLTDPEGRQMQWASELEARLPAIRQALKDAGVTL